MLCELRMNAIALPEVAGKGSEIRLLLGIDTM